MLDIITELTAVTTLIKNTSVSWNITSLDEKGTLCFSFLHVSFVFFRNKLCTHITLQNNLPLCSTAVPGNTAWLETVCLEKPSFPQDPKFDIVKRSTDSTELKNK